MKNLKIRLRCLGCGSFGMPFQRIRQMQLDFTITAKRQKIGIQYKKSKTGNCKYQNKLSAEQEMEAMDKFLTSNSGRTG